MAVREIPRNYRSLTGRVASRKCANGAFESSLERDFFTILDFDPHVMRFDTQPVRIEYIGPTGKAQSYIPDVLAHYGNAPWWVELPPTTLYEVKYRNDLRENWTQLRHRFKAARSFARSKGWRFKIVTERDIRTPYLDNARFLTPYKRRSLDTDLSAIDLLEETLLDMREATPESLLAACTTDPFRRAELIPTLWTLIARHRIQADLTRPLSMNSTLWLFYTP